MDNDSQQRQSGDDEMGFGTGSVALPAESSTAKKAATAAANAESTESHLETRLVSQDWDANEIVTRRTTLVYEKSKLISVTQL